MFLSYGQDRCLLLASGVSQPNPATGARCNPSEQTVVPFLLYLLHMLLGSALSVIFSGVCQWRFYYICAVWLETHSDTCCVALAKHYCQ